MITNNTSGKIVLESETYFHEQCTTFTFVFCFVIIGQLCLYGIAGNTFAIFVLHKDNFNKVTLFLFKALACADNSVLVLSFVILSLVFGLLPYIHAPVAATNIVPYIIKYGHPLAYMSHCCTIWITVVLAIFRYIAVCHPLNAVKWCTMFRARLLITLIVLTAVLFNIPRFFQFEIVSKEKLNPATNTTYQLYYVRETAIAEEKLFGAIYTNMLYTAVAIVTPVLALIIINGSLINEIRKVKNRRNAVGLPNKVDENITLVMIVIILTVIVCHTPDRVVMTLRLFVPWHYFVCPRFLYYTLNVCNLLIILNSSTNFIVYYLLWPAFHKKLVNLLCPRTVNV